MRVPRFVVAACLLSLSTATSAFAAPKATKLRCEYLANPLAVEAAAPRLSWIIESDGRGVKQTAYRILAAPSAPSAADGLSLIPH